MSCTTSTPAITLSTVGGVLTATMVISPDAGNLAAVRANGLFVGGGGGWVELAATLTYSAATAPFYVATTSVDLTATLSPGMRLRVTQLGTIRYFVVTAVTAGNVTLYAVNVSQVLDPAAITLPGYSVGASPFAFPVSAPFATGMVAFTAAASAPWGYLLLDGAAYSRSAFSALFAAIGVVYGVGDGSTTFNVPDGRGRSFVGVGSNPVVAAQGNNDGIAEANRRGTKHQHTPHAHAPSSGAFVIGSVNNPITVGGTGNAAVGAASGTTATADGGSGVATDPLDGGAYIAFTPIIKF